MIDIETMGNTPRAPVLSIGAVFFDPETGELGDEFYQVVDLQDALYWRKAQGDTLGWWLGQGESVRKSLTKGGSSLKDVLKSFAAFCKKGGGNIRPWGNGADFDIAILNDAFAQQKITPPWKHWNVEHCRTLVSLTDSYIDRRDFKRKGTHHNALDDAKHQVEWVSSMWAMIRKALASGQKTLV